MGTLEFTAEELDGASGWLPAPRTTRQGWDPKREAQEVAARYGVAVDELFLLPSAPGARDGLVCEARRALCYALRQRKWPLERIGRFVGRDHSTVVSMLAKARREILGPGR